MTSLALVVNNHCTEENSQEGGYVKADVENGYYRVANELGLALCKVQLSDRESRLVHAVMMKTFGFNKSIDWICNAQLAELTGIGIGHIGETKTRLLSRRILIKNGRKIGINTIVSEWVKNPKTGLNKKPETRFNKTLKRVNKNPTQGSEKPQAGLHNRQDTITKDTITKDITNKSKSTRVKKPEQFKKFFNLYPFHRKGGSNVQAWKAWKSEKLTEQDAQLALNWLIETQKVNPEWKVDGYGQFVLGITNFIRNRNWLTPIPNQRNQVNRNNSQSVSDHNQQAMDEWVASKQPEIEVNP